jgi:hypothetical protein
LALTAPVKTKNDSVDVVLSENAMRVLEACAFAEGVTKEEMAARVLELYAEWMMEDEDVSQG